MPIHVLLGVTLRGWIRIGLVGCAIALLFLNWTLRSVPTETGTANFEVVRLDELPPPDGEASENVGAPLLVNDDWYVRNMATAHGAVVIEVEAKDPSQTETIARTLIEPIKDDYAEILVYVNQLGDDSDLPARRMQWTPRDGYVEISYD